VALNILWSGGKLIHQAFGGLMDYADPALTSQIHQHLKVICHDLGVRYHGMRFRHTGGRVLIEVHLLFSYAESLGEAHRLATELEARLESVLDMPSEVVTHLEAAEDHASVHVTRQQTRE
jgi:divalent metal cation (Fe/Co/Zn/Cd) transporter